MWRRSAKHWFDMICVYDAMTWRPHLLPLSAGHPPARPQITSIAATSLVSYTTSLVASVVWDDVLRI
jgi:hypothetical protein